VKPSSTAGAYPRAELDDRPKFKVVIIYEDTAAGKRAKHFYDRVIRELIEECDFSLALPRDGRDAILRRTSEDGAMAGRSMLMERAAANECHFVSPFLERFLTGVLKNPIATVKWLLHRRGQHRRNELGQQGTGARFKFAGKSPANLGGESANKSGDKQEIGVTCRDTSISLCNRCKVDISIIRSARASMDRRCASQELRFDMITTTATMIIRRRAIYFD
jgi:hypothetical protein